MLKAWGKQGESCKASLGFRKGEMGKPAVWELVLALSWLIAA